VVIVKFHNVAATPPDLLLTRSSMREKPTIPEERLRACLQEHYDLIPVTLEFLPLGLDYDAGVYRVVSEQGAAYLLKATTRPLYEPRCLIPRYLNDQGITAVVAPLRTKNRTLWVQIEGWTVILYPFIEGETSWAGMTDEYWEETGAIFKRIHRVMLPSGGFELLRKETFDPAEYARWIGAFEVHYLHESSGKGSDARRALRSSWMAHQSAIRAAVASLEKLADILQEQSGPYVICHADLHARNLIRDGSGHVFVIDWDEVMLAPKERDFIFVREPQAEAFFQGYGQVEIDWIALTYYCYERVIQDVIECAREVFFRDDLGEESRSDSVKLFDDILAEKASNLAAAYAAAAHLLSRRNVY
jgi:spectinomycin phosphotransferase